MWNLLVMKIATLYFSILQAPRARVHSLAHFCSEGFHSLSRCKLDGSSSKLLASRNYGIEGGYSRRWFRKSVTTKTGGKSTTNQQNKASSIADEILDQKVSESTAVDVNIAGVHGIQKIQYYGAEEMAVGKNSDSLVTVIVFDIETTGLSRKDERIVEFASLDLSGGKNSTFQTLVNPERIVANAGVHGITTSMVCKADVPRMKDLIPILLKYAESRKKPGGQLLWVGHNCRTFDVPFLINEFNRCSYEIPEDWLFMDTLVLARKFVKSGATRVPSKVSLEKLCEHYDVRAFGRAHRAMSDVYSLTQVLQRLTFDLKVSLPGLVEEAFTAADLIQGKKRKSAN